MKASYSKDLAQLRAMIADLKRVDARREAGRKAEAVRLASTRASVSPPLHPRDAAEMDRAMGVNPAPAIMPHKLPDGRFVMHNVRPSEVSPEHVRRPAARDGMDPRDADFMDGRFDPRLNRATPSSTGVRLSGGRPAMSHAAFAAARKGGAT